MNTLDMTLPLQKFCLILTQTFLCKDKILKNNSYVIAKIEIFATFLIKMVLEISFAKKTFTSCFQMLLFSLFHVSESILSFVNYFITEHQFNHIPALISV